ncbi:MAG: Nif3-like dinuclear metal center hexameric protein [Bacteroidetes bacterium]|nr:Nif3-like dinuclear metal center hexameric protein [Bacteroidota bacterium]
MKANEIISYLNEWAPLAYQESYDNAGLIIGNGDQEVSGIIITLDVTPEVLEEAKKRKCNFILTHHPPVFKPVRSINPASFPGNIIYQAINNKQLIFALHTNVDNTHDGMNHNICQIIGLRETRILKPLPNQLAKLVTFCPVKFAAAVREALFQAGAGKLGEYDSCSFNAEGFGTFRALEKAQPYVGKKNIIHQEPELKIETIFPVHHQQEIIRALKKTHPYEEVAFDIIPLLNTFREAGSGMIGTLTKPMSAKTFLKQIRKKFQIPCLKYSGDDMKTIRTVAVCGGAGSFLIPEAISHKADVFLTGDMKYHDFFDTPQNLLLIDFGHYESEQTVKSLLFNQLHKKFPTFAILISETNTNPVKYI